jgi:hypothetical protein
LWQRVFDPLTGAAERIVRQHGDDGADVLAARAADDNLRDGRHDDIQRSQRAGGRPRNSSVAPIQRRTAA